MPQTDNPVAPPHDTPDRLGFRRRPMEPWYNPTQLALIGWRTVVSGLFGTYADKREMQACLDNVAVFDQLADRDEVWLDYVSDLGSGWDSTYALAYLLGRDTLSVANGVAGDDNPVETRRGNILVMGGDQVYPTPSTDEYTNRLSGPYRAARSYTETDAPGVDAPGRSAGAVDAPVLLAVPGNHDWYDGLTAFLKLFCQQRWIGGWRTVQTRSYFAVQLPHGWWLWGIDIQLCGDIDRPQLQFFEKVNRQCQPGDKVILCTAEPSWVYQAVKRSDQSYRNLDWFCRKYITEPDNPALNRLELPVTLTGDLHHFSSYEAVGTNAPVWKITAGGGGAFVHPTHQLPTRFRLGNAQQPDAPATTYEQRGVFPEPATSRRLALGNGLFAFLNPWFGALMGVICFLLAYGLAIVSDSPPPGVAQPGVVRRDVVGRVYELLGDYESLSAWFARVNTAIAYSPALLLLLFAVIGGFYQFADRTTHRFRWAGAAGLLHGFAQAGVVVTTVLAWTYVFSQPNVVETLDAWVNHDQDPFLQELPDSWRVLLVDGLLQLVKIGALVIVGGLLSGTLMGVYLLLTTLLLRVHETEAFSSLRIPDFKNFLRLHLTPDALTIYAVKVPRVPRQWTYRPGATNGEPWYVPAQGQPLEPGLIQPPIVVPNGVTTLLPPDPDVVAATTLP